MARHGAWLLVACRPVPVLAEVSVIVAGMCAMDMRKFVAATLTANALVPLPYVLLGSIASDGPAFYIAFGLSMLLSGFLWYLGQSQRPMAEPADQAGKR